jgi:putative restriction endonuclease
VRIAIVNIYNVISYRKGEWSNLSQRPWVSEIKAALSELGGYATLEDIYNKVEERGIIDLHSYKDWKAQIRKQIYLHSSDCDIFKGIPGDETDIFYSIEGKGRGFWGLRDFEPSENNVDLTEDDLSFVEGKKKLRQHVIRERNPKVIRLAKEKFKRENGGRLFCEICGFDFYEVYGEIGEDFIEGHHTIPVSELEEGQLTRIEDIALVCSNCHRMLHRRRPWLTKEQLKDLIKKE